MNRVKINVTIDPTILKEFKQRCTNVSRWFENKVKEELAKEDSKYLLMTNEFKLQDFWKYLESKYEPNKLRIGGLQLKKELGMRFGLDKRTTEKYEKYLLEYDLIRSHPNYGYTFLIRPSYGWIRQEVEYEAIMEKVNKEVDDILSAKPKEEEHGEKTE